MVTNSVIISVIRYAAPLLIDSTKAQLQKLQTLIIKNARPIIGFISYKMSTVQILEKLKWQTAHHMIMSESLKFFHKIVFNQEPKCMNNYFTYSLCRSDVVRLVRKPMIKDRPKSKYFLIGTRSQAGLGISSNFIKRTINTRAC